MPAAFSRAKSLPTSGAAGDAVPICYQPEDRQGTQARNSAGAFSLDHLVRERDAHGNQMKNSFGAMSEIVTRMR
jgi:hypothetical protein